MSPPKDSRPDNYEMNAKICRLVEQCPFMYDRSHPQYLRKEVCDEAWIRIAKEMGESVFPCRERWRNIRTSFARSINTNKVPSSANRTKPYYLHEELKFLARHITPGVPVRNRKRATSGSGEESEHIEVSVGEDTFNGFERLSALGAGESTDTQNGHESAGNSWQQRLQQLPAHMNGSESGGGGGGGGRGGGNDDAGIEHDSCNSSLNGNDPRREDEPSCSRFARLPPPPLQAAPHTTLQRCNDETEAAAALQQIQLSSNTATLCPPLSKRPRKGSDLTGLDDGSGGIDLANVELQQRQRRGSNADASFLHELQTELGGMNHRQKIHLKRRVYEALSEIYPLTTTTAENNAASDATCSQLALAALLRVENLCRNLKCENISSAPSAVPDVALLRKEAVESPTIDATNPVQAGAVIAIAASKRNNVRTRGTTRAAAAERLKANAETNGTAVKDEPEVAD